MSGFLKEVILPMVLIGLILLIGFEAAESNNKVNSYGYFKMNSPTVWSKGVESKESRALLRDKT